MEDVLRTPVEVFREAHDDGQDAVLNSKNARGVEQPTTVQCKFSAVASRTLKPSDLAIEEEHIEELTRAGLSDRYILMTNMSVSAPAAVKVRKRLRELGVKRPHVFGKEFLTRVIRGSSKLRALVPLVYGLGDLSIILDDRRAKQAKAVLGHLQSSLRTYVTTAPHVKAVRSLAKHKIVLLLGDPATGKSTIAAVLATVAADNPRHRCFKADGPIELMANWNPDEGGALYWIDDAFGPNQLRQDFVDAWITMMPKVQAAIVGGNSFVLTSRRHIYEAAKPKLGSRNHPLFRNEDAIVQVGDLTQGERSQILYNHIKAGNQPKHWKTHLKNNHVEELAREALLIPEIARQLGDRAYTQRVQLTRDSLLHFIRDNRTFLNETIKELSKDSRAALTMVFLHGGKMAIGNPSPNMQELVIRHYDIDREALGEALGHLKGSFLVEKTDGGQLFWTFKHPTLADALASTLGETEGMRELYLRGVKVETVLSNTACVSEPVIGNFVLIPETLDGLLVERLLETPDEPGLNRQLFSFLADKASDSVLRALFAKAPGLFDRKAIASHRAGYDPKLRACARAHSLNILPPQARLTMAAVLEDDLFDEMDVSFLDDDRILELFSTSTLLGLVSRIKNELIPKYEEAIETCVEDADLDLEPSDNFEDLSSAVTDLQHFLDDKDSDALLSAQMLSNSIENGIERVAENKEKRQRERERDDWMWEELDESTRSRSQSQVTVPPAEDTRSNASPHPRSIFSDVDQ
ncbi:MULTISPECIES: hypothetical protein [unclassified Bradyrhizobium]|uniref:nSTAND3 domain-containing NTPase n=1 Tax=unclassified Bradyrhizobium TaxID=2631580 RepID=UPI002916E4A7|nr:MULTISPECIES: hypothetical protein [unclassified Bradyrhizobium]